MSAEEIETVLDVEGNGATVTITQRRELKIDDLFDDNDELRLWEDTAGWSGYLREETEDGDTAFYHINTVHDEDDWLRKVRVGQQAVHNAVIQHIEDPHAGEPGRFVRGATPP